MIRINLLPDEYRRKARTPIRMLAAVLVVVAINTSLLAYWAWLAFGVAAEVETRRSVLQLEMDGLKPQVAYHQALQAETQVHASRETTLAQITQNRILWTRQVDEMIDVVAAGRDGTRHFVWFDDLQVKLETPTGARGRTQEYGSLKAKAHSGSAQMAQLSYFLDDLVDPEVSAMPMTFAEPASPQAKKNEPDEDLIPSETWSFGLDMPILGPEERTRPSTQEVTR